MRKLKLEGSAAASKGSLAQQAAGATRVTTPGGSGGKTAVEQEQDLADEPVLGPVLVDLKGAVLAAGLSRLSQSRRVVSLVPHHGPGVASALCRLGFEPVGDYVTLAKRLARPSEEAVQEAASKAVPVS